MNPSHTVRFRALRFEPPLLLIALLSIVHGLFYFVALGYDAVDDAYISFRYAHNAILGYGLVFNPGERVEGFTNFLWTVLMIPLEGLGIDVGRASIVLGALFALGVLWLVVRFAAAAGRPGAGLLAALLLAVDGSFALWAVGGLETPLFTFLIFAGALLYVREQSEDTAFASQRNSTSRTDPASSNFQSPVSNPQPLTSRPPGVHLPPSALAFALAAMTRPEGLLVFAITVAHQAVWRLISERRLWAPRDLWRVVAFGALFVPYWLGRWQYYHSFLPNSFYAKVSPGGPQAQLLRGWNHLAQFVGVHAGWFILLPPLVAIINSVRAALPGGVQGQRPSRGGGGEHPLFWTSYFAALLIPYCAYIVYVGGDWSVGRFFMPLLPFFYLLFAAGLADVWTWLASRARALSRHDAPASRAGTPAAISEESVPARDTRVRPQLSWALAASLALAVLLFVFSSWNGEYGIYIRGFDAGRATAAREAMGRWLRTHAPRGTLIAVDAAGQVPYFSGLPAIDMFGINDWHIGRLPVATLGQGTPGHEKFDLGYVVGRGPKYVIIYGTLLDAVKEYTRAPVEWTDDPALSRFLTLYVRRD